MALSTLHRFFAPRAAAGMRSRRLGVEALEDRRLLSATLVVGGANDHAAQYHSINAAVAAAHSGDTIRVDPGTYHESVTVSKTLTLVADNRGGVVVDPGTLGSGFNVQADNVKILGFTVQDAIGAAGVFLSRSYSGYDVEHNLLRNNSIGIYFNSDGANTSEVEGNLFQNNNNGLGVAPAAGNGIYSDKGLSNAEIADNVFTGQQNASMLFVGDPTVSPSQLQFNLQIEGNLLQNDATIILINTYDSTITHNVSVGSNGSGIFFGGNVHNVEVSHNVLQNGVYTGINLRTDPVDYGPGAATPNTNNRITDNAISGFGDSGIRLREGAAGNLVEGNRLVGNGTAGDPTTGDGISLENAKTNVIRNNQAIGNSRDGIRIDALSGGNRIENNHLQKNGEYDARDDSIGTRTAGTDDFWINNAGRTVNRPGLLARRDDADNDDNQDG